MVSRPARFADARAYCPRPIRCLRIGLAVIIGVMLSAGTLAAQHTPVGTRISSTAQVSWEEGNGQVFTAVSAPAIVEVGFGGGFEVEPPGFITVDPGAQGIFRHALRNAQNTADTFSLTATSRRGWPVHVYRDTHGNGVITASDIPIAWTGTVVIAPGSEAPLVIVVDVPALATVRDLTDTITVTARSGIDPTQTSAVMDELHIRSAGIIVALTEAVDRQNATPGDIVTYTLSYSATGTTPASNFQITDIIPAGATYISGSLRLNGVLLTDSGDADPGIFDSATNRVVVSLPTVSGGDTGTVTFQVRVSS